MNKIYLSFLVFILPWSYLEAKDFSFPEYKGWEVSTDYPVYTPEKLWDYINGAADGYLTYGFERLEMAVYSNGEQTVKVEVYTHKDSKNAFGIYAAERSPDYQFLDIGAEAYHQGRVLNFYKGDKYIKIQADSDKNSIHKDMIGIGTKISESISGKDELPSYLQYFPESEKLPHTERFIAKNFLGHDFFNEVFTADYKWGSESFTLFLTQKQSGEEIKMLLNNYFEFTDQDMENPTEGEYIISDRYNGDVHAIWDSKILYGVFGTENEKLRRAYLEEMKNFIPDKDAH